MSRIGSPLTPTSSGRAPRKLFHEVFIGVAIDYACPARYAFYTFDGYYCWDIQEKVYVGAPVCDGDICDPYQLHKIILEEIRLYMHSRKLKVIMAGLASHEDSAIKRLGYMLWRRADILPCLVSAQGDSLDEIACSAARKTTHYLSATQLPGLPKVLVGYRHEVEVDANGAVAFSGLEGYRQHCCGDTWKLLKSAALRVRQQGKSIVFINSTPQGGGVAILRHSMIRFLRLLGVNVHWFVMRPNPDVFEITKKKFHNILQGVSSAGTRLTQGDKDLWMRWCDTNVKTYWKDGPVTSASVVVIDDPQPCGIIPIIKEVNPQATLVYRSHIELRSDLIACEGSETHQVWEFLWNFIKSVDIFVSHPVKAFVPQSVLTHPTMKHLQMPACTDPIDGLNKDLDQFSISYYQTLFNRISREQTGCELNFARPYFIQISRFDPSKGIPDLINAYLIFREGIADSDVLIEDIPQLVITGHGSIDDPEASTIYDLAFAMTEDERAADFASDIILVRLGPSDQILNALLTGALAAFQLSIREGFEIKVTEALIKGIPVIAYASGGIPLQIIHGYDGYLFPVGAFDLVAAKMRDMVDNPGLVRSLRKPAHCRDWLLTPSNALRWMSVMLGEEPAVLEQPKYY